MKVSQSFSSRLGLYVITAVAALSLCSMTFLLLKSRQALQKEAVILAGNNLEKLTSDVEYVLAEVETSVESVEWLVKEHIDDPEYMYRITRNLILSNENVTGSTVAFVPDYYASKGKYYAPYSFVDCFDGNLKSIQMGNDEYHYFDMEWFSAPYSLGKPRWSEPYFDEGGGDQLMTTYSVPVRDTAGKIVAIMTADVSLELLTRSLKEVKLYKNSYSFILSRGGLYVAHPDSSILMTTSIFDMAEKYHSEDLAMLGEQMLNGDSGGHTLKMSDGKRYSVVFGPISNGWSTCFLSPYSEVFSELKTQMLVSILVMIVNMLLLFLIVRRIINRTSKPITEFAFTALNIAKGNFDTKIPDVNTNDEIKRLRESLTFMVQSIREYMTQLKAATASKERMESELYIASSIQGSMLPKNFPDNGDVDLHAILIPAKEVGGDLYDFFVKDNCLYFAIGDVSGKGVPAALFMAITRFAFRFIAGLGMKQAEIMSRINSSISNGNETNMFVTMFIAKLDLSTGKMRYCNAGHNPILIVHPDGRSEYLHAKPNLAVGLFEDFRYEDEEIMLEKGTRLVAYTDGVTEAENAGKELFGEDRLMSFVSSEPSDKSSEQFLEDAIASVRSFTDGNEQNDDITLMSVKF